MPSLFTTRFSFPVQFLSHGGALAICLAAICTLSGCGGGKVDSKASPRVKATGKVEFDGKPLPAGTVTFINITSGNSATCEIYNGSYSSPSGQGPNPGDNTVTITGKEKSDGNPMWARPWTKQHVNVGTTDFKEDFSIKANEVKPFDPASIKVDD